MEGPVAFQLSPNTDAPLLLLLLLLLLPLLWGAAKAESGAVEPARVRAEPRGEGRCGIGGGG